MREEREEELRIQRDKEIERKRRENEERQLQEKVEREQKRKQAMQQAMEMAKEEAIREKMKQKLSKQNNVHNANVNDEKQDVDKLNNKTPREEINLINNHITQENDLKEQKNNNNSNEKAINNNNNSDNNKTIVANNNNSEKINNKQIQEELVMQLPSLSSCDSLSLVLQTPLETLQNMQFAVLMPTNGSGNGTALPIAVPITLPTNDGHSSHRTENRILTPTPYRYKKLIDSSTQTDNNSDYKLDSAKEKLLKEKLNNLELNYDSRGRKERRIRESVEERPKWGANRPPTRYMKQSEKDPLYQRRKLRQKIRQANDKRSYSPHSSDESQTASPRSYRKNLNRNGPRALWRKSDRLFGENMRFYQTELIPLESDKDHIYYKVKSNNECCCRCSCTSQYKDRTKTIDILKIDHNSSQEPDNEIDNRHRLPDYNMNVVLSDSSEVMQKLNNLHHGLHAKQELWRNTPTTPSLSTRRNSENI